MKKRFIIRTTLFRVFRITYKLVVQIFYRSLLCNYMVSFSPIYFQIILLSDI
jgi:hypothetical protein